MGIRFYCPNGHRLHVKAFQAGRRGICPHCDARFRIPRESEIPRGAPRVRSQGQADGPPEAIAFVAVETETADAACGGSPAVDGRPAPQPSGDVLAAALGNVWYVRPPSGGQYGPAGSDVLQRWLDEGRVSADTLVWRNGWPEWRLAGPLFPRLAAEAALPESEIATEPEPAATPASGIPGDRTADTIPARSAPVLHQQTASRTKKVAVIVTLVVLIGVLLIALIAVAHTAS